MQNRREYKRNREKVKKFYLDENKQKEKHAEEQKSEKTNPNRAQANKHYQERTRRLKEAAQRTNDRNYAKKKQEAPKEKLNNRLSVLTSHNLKQNPNRPH